jgi:hypothetical protein
MTILSVPTIADLRAYPTAGLVDGQQICVSSYANEGDNGGGIFYWSAASMAPDDGGINICPSIFFGASGQIIVGTGDGTKTTFYSGALSANIQPGSTVITCGALTLTDTGYGLMMGNGGVGGVIYSGNFKAHFTTPPGSGVQVFASYQQCATVGRWVRVYSGHVHSNWFGAVADGVTDASPALNQAIYYCVGNSKVLELDGLSYLINKPLIVFGYSYASAALVSFSMCGQKASDITAIPQIGPPLFGTQILCNYNNTAALMLNGVRNCHIADMNFLGQNNWVDSVYNTINYGSVSALSTFVVQPQGGGALARDSQFSPYSGIVLDPFLAALPADGGYPGFTDFYGPMNTLTSVTENLILERVNISNFVVGLMISPTNVSSSNTTNITCRDCEITYNKANVAVGDNNSRNLYWYGGTSAYAYTCFDGMSYGYGSGDPFKLFAAYLGYAKYLFAYNCMSASNFACYGAHAENFESIGFFGQNNHINVTPFLFSGCEIFPWTFGGADASITPLTACAPTLIYACAPVEFDSCTFAATTCYAMAWKNGTGTINHRAYPFRVITDTGFGHSQGTAQVTWKNCSWSFGYGDFPLAPSYNVPGEIGIADNQRLENCVMQDYSGMSVNLGISTVTDKIVATVPGDYSSYLMPLGCQMIVNTAGGATGFQFNGSSDPDRTFSLGTIPVTLSTVDLNLATFPITTTQAAQVRSGDLIYTTTPQTIPNSPTTTTTINTMCLGIVTAVDPVGLTVTIQGMPQGFNSGSTCALYVYWYARYLKPALATLTSGSATIIFTANQALKGPRRINGAGIPPGTYIVSGSGKTWVMSQAATVSASGVRIYDANMIQFSGTPV